MRGTAVLRAVPVILALAAFAGAGCEDPTGTERLAALRVQGTITSAVDGAPIVDMQVGMGWVTATGSGEKLTRTDSQGRYAVTVEDVFCVPGAFAIIGVIPAGYRQVLPSGEEPASIECTEEVQTFDILLEPISE